MVVGDNLLRDLHRLVAQGGQRPERAAPLAPTRASPSSLYPLISNQRLPESSWNHEEFPGWSRAGHRSSFPVSSVAGSTNRSLGSASDRDEALGTDQLDHLLRGVGE